MSRRKTTAPPATLKDVPFDAPYWPAQQKPEMIAVAKITPHPENPRLHPDGQIKAIGAAFDEFGVVIPVIVDERFRLMAGEGRWLTAKSKGIEYLPCIVVRGWDEAKKRRFMFSDNRLHELGDYDQVRLSAVAHELRVEGGELLSLGVDELSLAELEFGGRPPDPRGDETPPEPPAKPVSKPGDLWILGNHRILCGDATKAEDVTRALDGAVPNLMATDPPYGVEYDANWRNERVRADGSPIAGRAIGKVENDGKADWREAFLLFPGDVAYAWSADLRSKEAIEGLEAAGFVIRAQIIWAKQQFAIGRGDYHFQHEPCWYAVRKGRPGNWQGDRKQTTLWQIDKPQKSETGHSTQKPIECMRRPIINNSKPGEAIYEPFSGSGTTIIACEMSGRHARAIEISPPYVDVAVMRWQDFAKSDAVLAGDGRTFGQIAKARKRK